MTIRVTGEVVGISGPCILFLQKSMIRKQWQRYMYCPAEINYVIWSVCFVGSIGAVALLHSNPAVSQNLCHMIKKTICHICTWNWAVNTCICSLIEILVVPGIWKMWKLRRRVGRGLVFVCFLLQCTAAQRWRARHANCRWLKNTVWCTIQVTVSNKGKAPRVEEWMEKYCNMSHRIVIVYRCEYMIQGLFTMYCALCASVSRHVTCNIFIPTNVCCRKSGLTYFNPQLCQWSKRLIPIEAAAMDNSYVLLFVITGTTRSIASMALVWAYTQFFISCGVFTRLQWHCWSWVRSCGVLCLP